MALAAALALALLGCSESVSDDQRRLVDLDGGVLSDGGVLGPAVCGERARCPEGLECVLSDFDLPDGGAAGGVCLHGCEPGASPSGCRAAQVCVAAEGGRGACLPFARGRHRHRRGLP